MKKAFCRLMALPLIAAVGLSFAGCNGTKGSIFSRPTVGKVAGEKKEWIDVDSFTCYYGSLSGNAEETPVMGGETVTAMEALSSSTWRSFTARACLRTKTQSRSLRSCRRTERT